jgi:D-beta-D-heptose 7-phosphate kinase/D-beta-D-heptose 1-phosphate adenosyltransferase
MTQSLQPILVVGDVMLDEYWHGTATRLSPEAPVAVVTDVRKSFSLGGAGNVAATIADYDYPVALACAIGPDIEGQTIRRLVADAHIIDYLTEYQQPTTHKLRIYCDGHYTSRVDREDTSTRGYDLDLLGDLQPTLCIVSDYGKGVLHDPQPLIQACRERGIRTLVDPKRGFLHYQGAWMIKPNRKEFETYVGRFATLKEMRDLARDAMEAREISNMVVTLGADGMALITPHAFLHLPAEATKVVDVTGAGDVVVASLAHSIALGLTLGDALKQANLRAADAVSFVGTTLSRQKKSG